MKRTLAIFMSLVLIFASILSIDNSTNAAAKKAKLSIKRISVAQGKTKTVKLKNVNKKVKWTVKNKKIARISKKSGKYKNKITIKGIRAGKTIITAKYKGKKYKVTVKVGASKNAAATSEHLTKKRKK